MNKDAIILTPPNKYVTLTISFKGGDGDLISDKTWGDMGLGSTSPTLGLYVDNNQLVQDLSDCIFSTSQKPVIVKNLDLNKSYYFYDCVQGVGRGEWYEVIPDTLTSCTCSGDGTEKLEINFQQTKANICLTVVYDTL